MNEPPTGNESGEHLGEPVVGKASHAGKLRIQVPVHGTVDPLRNLRPLHGPQRARAMSSVCRGASR